MKRWISMVLIIAILGSVAIIFVEWRVQQAEQAYGPQLLKQMADNFISRFTNQKPTLQTLGKAPEFAGIKTWLNSGPLTMAGLKGKVVLVDFWTYSCINCIRTLPYVTKWYDTYKDKGFVVVGVHTPEFEFEKNTKNVQDAIARFGIHYPVAQDNDYGTWNNYRNEYWPADYLVNKDGQIVQTHFGEGDYDQTENAIRELLGLSATQIEIPKNSLGSVQSPEMYFGTDRLRNLASQQKPSASAHTYVLPNDLAMNTFALEGSWQYSPDAVRLAGDTGTVVLKFHAGAIHIVAASDQPATLSIVVDGKKQESISVQKSQLYTLYTSGAYVDHVIEITISGKGFQAFTFTFG